MVRPGMGYGRALRPTPPRVAPVRAWPEAEWFGDDTATLDEPMVVPATAVTNDRR